jgi:hypothetical protein
LDERHEGEESQYGKILEGCLGMGLTLQGGIIDLIGQRCRPDVSHKVNHIAWKIQTAKR